MTPSKSAVPFWLAVEPRVSTKRLTWVGRRSSRSATASAVGSVALLEAVENAVSIAGRTARKKRRGLMPPSHAHARASRPRTWWIASAPTTTPT